MGRENATIGVVGAKTRFDLISDFFLDFNRDPHKNQSLVEHYVKNLYDIDLTLMSLAIEELRSKERMPKWTEVRDSALKQANLSQNNEYYHCDDCGSDGLVRSVFKNDREMYKLEVGEEGNIYYCRIIGKCHCENAKPWKFSEVQIPTWIKSYSDMRNVPLSLAASEICIKMNKEARQ